MRNFKTKSVGEGSDGSPRHVMKEFTLSYLVGLAIIAVLSIGIYIALTHLVLGQQDSAVTINIAGRQRMLSQKIGLLAQDIQSGNTASRAILLDALALMERSQNALVNGGDLGITRSLSATSHQYYFGGPKPLDSLVRRFIATGRQFASESHDRSEVSSAYRDLQGLAHATLLPALDHAVSLFQSQADMRVKRLRIAQELGVGIILCVLVLETLFIFRPLAKRLAQNTRQLLDQDAKASVLLAESGTANMWLEMAEQIAHIGHWRIMLPDYTIIWSEEIYRIHGVSPETYKPDIETAVGFYHQDDRQQVADAIEKAVGDLSPFEFALRIVRKDGEIRYVQSRGVTTIGADGTASMLFGVFLDVTEQRNIEAALRLANSTLDQIAYTDALTEIPNRRRFDENMDRAWRLAVRARDVMSVALIDVDHFKAYNDLYGHPVGDECLRKVARAINSVVRRPGDEVARYGGEEFIMLLTSTDLAGAMLLAERARKAVETLAIEHAKTATGTGVISVSIGVASVVAGEPTSAADKDSLVAEADAMLYEAKRAGRNRVVSKLQTNKTTAGLPEEEAARLAMLSSYERAGATNRAADLDRIARLAASLMNAPIGLVSIVGKDEQTFAGNFGLEGINSTKRDVSFCAQTMMGKGPMVINDATKDPRFEDNALVVGEMGIRYYSGAPILSKRTGLPLGALCVIDRATRRSTTAAERAILSELADMAAILIEEKAEKAS